jgi:hypothetical protein
VPVPLAALLAALWIAKDLVLYPYLRRFYRSEGVERRMNGLILVVEPSA